MEIITYRTSFSEVEIGDVISNTITKAKSTIKEITKYGVRLENLNDSNLSDFANKWGLNKGLKEGYITIRKNK
jgi:hypothetical protein